MNNIAIRVDHLSKLYPAVAPRARHLGRAQQRHDTPSTRLRTRLRDALATFLVVSLQLSVVNHVWPRQLGLITDNSKLKTDTPSSGRSRTSPSRSSRARSSGIPSTRLREASQWDRTGIGRNGAEKSTLPSTSGRRSALRTRLKILSRITEPTAGRAYVRVNAPCCIERTNRVQSVEGVESNDET